MVTKIGFHMLPRISLTHGIKEGLISNLFVLCILSQHSLPSWLICHVLVGDFQGSFLCVRACLSLPFQCLYNIIGFLFLFLPCCNISVKSVFKMTLFLQLIIDISYFCTWIQYVNTFPSVESSATLTGSLAVCIWDSSGGNEPDSLSPAFLDSYGSI